MLTVSATCGRKMPSQPSCSLEAITAHLLMLISDWLQFSLLDCCFCCISSIKIFWQIRTRWVLRRFRKGKIGHCGHCFLATMPTSLFVECITTRLSFSQNFRGIKKQKRDPMWSTHSISRTQELVFLPPGQVSPVAFLTVSAPGT